MDRYFEELQQKIDSILETQEDILERLEKQDQAEEEELLRANELNEIWRCSRATGLKIRQAGIRSGILTPVQLPSGSIRYRKSEALNLNHKSHTL